jgi:hypothetical protein
MNRCSLSMVIKEMKVKSEMRFHFTLSGLDLMNIKFHNYLEKKKYSYIAVSIKSHRPYRKFRCFPKG